MNPYLDAITAAGGTVLDLGCGTGRNARALRREGRRVCAVDMDFDALSTARSLSETGDAPFFCAGRAQALPFGDAVFDAVQCIDMFHWCESAGDFSAAWDEAWRVLRPGGIFHARFLIQDFASDTKTGWFLIDGTALREKVMRCGGEWLEVLQAEEESARFTLKKPAR